MNLRIASLGALLASPCDGIVLKGDPCDTAPPPGETGETDTPHTGETGEPEGKLPPPWVEESFIHAPAGAEVVSLEPAWWWPVFKLSTRAEILDDSSILVVALADATWIETEGAEGTVCGIHYVLYGDYSCDVPSVPHVQLSHTTCAFSDVETWEARFQELYWTFRLDPVLEDLPARWAEDWWSEGTLSASEHGGGSIVADGTSLPYETQDLAFYAWAGSHRVTMEELCDVSLNGWRDPEADGEYSMEAYGSATLALPFPPE